jgi:hypothetical protein
MTMTLNHPRTTGAVRAALLMLVLVVAVAVTWGIAAARYGSTPTATQAKPSDQSRIGTTLATRPIGLPDGATNEAHRYGPTRPDTSPSHIGPPKGGVVWHPTGQTAQNFHGSGS